MAMKLKLTMQDGSIVEVEARKFSHYIGGARYWFAYHKGTDIFGQVVTHLDSGKRVCEVPALYAAACLSDTKAAAKMAIDKLVERVGADKVKSVLNAAKKAAA